MQEIMWSVTSIRSLASILKDCAGVILIYTEEVIDKSLAGRMMSVSTSDMQVMALGKSNTLRRKGTGNGNVVDFNTRLEELPTVLIGMFCNYPMTYNMIFQNGKCDAVLTFRRTLP